MAPIMLKVFSLDGSLNLRGVQAHQIFRDAQDRAFEQRTTDRTRNAFANHLFAKIVRMLGGKPVAVPAEPDAAPVLGEDAEQWLRDGFARHLADIGYTRLDARLTTAKKLGDDLAGDEREDALDFLDQWRRDPNGQPCCALLGETGMGKTTTCKAFAHFLLDARLSDRTVPLPIYLDLRLLGEDAKSLPRLDTIVDAVLQRSWQGGRTESPPSFAEVQRLVREEGAMIIFDGLDEVLVHLPQRAGQQFSRELLSILPPAFWPRRRKPDMPGRPGRILLSCRTHYFRSVRDQQTHLTAEDRDDVRDSDYRVFELLPLTDVQVRTYLSASLPEPEVDRALDTIRAVHNLPELAERPYTLSLIARHLPQIERWKMEGRRVTGVDLYRHMVLSWLERDAGKHEFDGEHKQQMMEHVAAQLWRGGSRTWTARRMDDWLVEFLEATPDVARHYRDKQLDVLKKDLRTATFLVRQGDAAFRFAHTSLQEFFLAAYLLRALREGRPERWEMDRPSRETLDFLGQMLLGEGSPARSGGAVSAADGTALATLRAMRGSYRTRVSELAFDYVLYASSRDYPAPSPAGFVLDGADLRDWKISGDPAGGVDVSATRVEGSGRHGRAARVGSQEVEPAGRGAAAGKLLNLRGASFRKARLRGTTFHYVDLDSADFSGADLLRAELIGGRARAAQFGGAQLVGTVFRDLDLSQAVFNGVVPYRAQFLRCGLQGQTGLRAGLPGALFALCDGSDEARPVAKQKSRLAALGGHDDWVLSCAFAPDGKRIASASSDQTIRIWDAASGENLLTLSGHSDSVRSCAFAPDGKRIASASDDQTIRIWDAASGENLLTLNGHSRPVLSCAFAPDGKRIASASDDQTIRIWDAASGENLLTLNGHSGPVLSCAFAPDGKRIASASDDQTIRIWDAASGENLLTLNGHSRPVWSCAFAPDGKRIAFASDDQTIRIWDAASGENLLTLNGHSRPVLSCAFAPDGKRIASASDDQTIRIWDAASGENLLTLDGHSGPVLSCAFAPDGKRIASASDDQTIRIWDAASGENLLTLDGHSGPVLSCAFAPDGKRIASASDDQTIRIWDAASGENLLTLNGHSGPVWSCAFAPDGKRIASASDDQTIRIWDAASGENLLTLDGHSGPVLSCAFAPDGKRIASASDDQTIRIWDAASGENLLTLNGHSRPVLSCAFAPDGKRIASASDDQTIRIWDAASGENLLTLDGHSGPVLSCAFAPDGKRIASASDDQTIRIWDAASGENLLTLNGHSGWVESCAFAPDGKRIASASDDQTIRIWDAASGENLLTLNGHSGPVWSCAFVPTPPPSFGSGETRIVSASLDGTIRIWDPRTGEEIGPRIHQFDDGAFAALAADGSRAIQVSRNAWRHLGWLVPDATGALTRYPAEVFGPLPEAAG